ncbi:hypothetical protein FQN50_002474 [Emmonsiellopsis sp. PD_5]|nr:hypothetical protein FQN50_002474 [Emmonsiellopsis sp. PD_5]
MSTPQRPPPPPPPPSARPPQLFTGRHFAYAMVASVGAGLLSMAFFRNQKKRIAEVRGGQR